MIVDWPENDIYLERWEGAGKINIGRHFLESDFRLTRLLNGRLEIFCQHQESLESQMLPWNREAQFKGVTENGATINATGITFSYRRTQAGVTFLVGMAQQVEHIRHKETEDDVVSIRCDLTNFDFGLSSHVRPIYLDLDGFEVQLVR